MVSKVAGWIAAAAVLAGRRAWQEMQAMAGDAQRWPNCCKLQMDCEGTPSSCFLQGADQPAADELAFRSCRYLGSVGAKARCRGIVSTTVLQDTASDVL